MVAEPVRLYIGYYSNLTENIPWMVIFLVLTTAPQTAVCYYLMLGQYDLKPVDQAVQVVMAGFIHLELVMGLGTIRRVYRRRREKYFLVEHALRQGMEQQEAQQREAQQQQQAQAAGQIGQRAGEAGLRLR